jgi:hypothetical protein
MVISPSGKDVRPTSYTFAALTDAGADKQRVKMVTNKSRNLTIRIHNVLQI